MDEYMGDFLFDTFQPFHFYHDASVDYFIPQGEASNTVISKDTYTKYIEELPLANSPGVFGLHPNAEIGYYTKATKEVKFNSAAYSLQRCWFYLCYFPEGGGV